MSLSAALLLGDPALAQCVVNISTGYDQDAGVVLVEGAQDDEYSVEVPTAAILPALTGGVGQGFPIPPWVSNSDTSLWVSSAANSSDSPGTFTYEIRFNLAAGMNPASLAVVGTFTGDCQVIDVVINGNSTGIISTGFNLLSPFPPNAGLGLFQTGENTLQFLVSNGGDAANPAGLRVDACVEVAAAQRRQFELSTGLDQENLVVLPNGAADTEYTVTGPAGSGIGPRSATVVNDTGPPIPPWLGSSLQSKWIGVEAGGNGPAGDYTYAVTVDLVAGVDAALSAIGGGFAADDEVVSIRINGQVTGIAGAGPAALIPFPPAATRGLLVSGLNTIELVVHNETAGPTGLRVDAEVVACGVPPPFAIAESLFSLDTGFDDQAGATFAAGTDDNYDAIGPPGTGVCHTEAFVINDQAYPIAPFGPWAGSTAFSKWIGIQSDSNGPPGLYAFRIVVNVPGGIDAGALKLLGAWSTDNSGPDIAINGNSTGISSDGNFTVFHPFPPDAGLGLFQTGDNLVEFLVDNAAPGTNPVGLRVEGVAGTGVDPADLSTGLGARGIGPLPAGFDDGRYVVTVSVPGPPQTRPAALLRQPPAPNAPGSKWIGIDADDPSGTQGTYPFIITFDLGAAVNPNRAVLAGGWAASERGMDVELNGASLQFSSPGPGELSPFPPGAGRGHFVPGANRLVFVADNSAGGSGVPALRVEARAESVAAANPLDISTGFDQAAGAVIGDGENDADYLVTDPFSVTEQAVAIPAAEAPIPPWIENTNTSRWIILPGGVAASPGLYRFQMSVTLATAEDAASAVLAGGWAVDDSGADILINEVSTGATNGGGFVTLTPFPPDLGLGLFQAGNNIIEFAVQNGGDAPNPSGLRVDAVVEVRKKPGQEQEFVRGDTNGDGIRNLTDGVFVLNFLFLGGSAPPCKEAANTNNDGTLNLTDGVFILNFLFLGGNPPPAPFPGCGLDPTGEVLECAMFTPCA